MSGCGYSLRGYLNDDSTPLPSVVSIAITSDNPELTHALRQRFALLGMQTADSPAPTIRLNNLTFQRYKLVGILTEVRLALTGTATYTINGAPQTFVVTVSRSYQYNEANLSTADSEGAQVALWLYQDFASRVAEQYHALYSR